MEKVSGAMGVIMATGACVYSECIRSTFRVAKQTLSRARAPAGGAACESGCGAAVAVARLAWAGISRWVHWRAVSGWTVMVERERASMLSLKPSHGASRSQQPDRGHPDDRGQDQ
jgi:hypothetical protein